MMDDAARENLLIWTPYGIVVVLGFLAGLLWPRSRAPFVAAAAIVMGYFVLIAVTGIWYAACRECEAYQSYDSTRLIDLYMAILFGAILAAGALLFVWLGTVIGLAARRVRSQ
jgi:hypothetical protein